MQYGHVYLTQVWTDFSQPILSSNGTMGGNTFAVSCSGTYDASRFDAWKAFDGKAKATQDTYWMAGCPASITFYNPNALKISTLGVRNYMYASTSITKDYTIEGSNDNSNWTTLVTGTNTEQTAGAKWYITLPNTTAYKYHKFTVNTVYSQYALVEEFFITAQYQTAATNFIQFPISFSNTNYGFCLGFIGGNSGKAYASNKTVSTIELYNESAENGSYIAFGY